MLFNEEYIFLSQGQGIITNEFSIYIKTIWRFPTHREYMMHAFIDTGATTSVAHQYALPVYKWKKLINLVYAKVADNRRISINVLCRESFLLDKWIYGPNS